MKLTVGINSGDDVKKLIECGGDEFFSSVLIDNLYLSARPSLKQYNFSIEEIDQVSKIVLKNNKNFFIAMNEPYDDDEIPDILSIMNNMIDIGISGFIISSIPLLLKIKNSRKNYGKLILSCLALALNEGSISMYKDMGIHRIILTRQNRIEEIEYFIKKFPNLEFETFGFFDKCNNLDELCRTTDYINFNDKKYKKEGCICHIAKTHEIVVSNSMKKIDNYENRIRDNLLWRIGCSHCFIRRLKKIGVTAVKLASRGWSFNKKLKVVKNLDELRRIEESKIKNLEFIKVSKLRFKELMGYDCHLPYDCYYRE